MVARGRISASARMYNAILFLRVENVGSKVAALARANDNVLLYIGVA